MLPTDTVYGLMCDADSEEAAARLYGSRAAQAIQPTAVVFPDVDSLFSRLRLLEAEHGPVAARAASRSSDAGAAEPGSQLRVAERRAAGHDRGAGTCASPARRRGREERLGRRRHECQPPRRARSAATRRRPGCDPRRASSAALDGGDAAGCAVDRDRPHRARARDPSPWRGRSRRGDRDDPRCPALRPLRQAWSGRQRPPAEVRCPLQ